MLKYHAPQPLGSGQSGQTMSMHTARRDNWPLDNLSDINCTAHFVYVVGNDNSGPLTVLQLSTTDLSTLNTWTLPTAAATNGLDSWSILPAADDSMQFVISNQNSSSFQLVDGGALQLSNLGYYRQAGISAIEQTRASPSSASATAPPAPGTSTGIGRELMDARFPRSI